MIRIGVETKFPRLFMATATTVFDKAGEMLTDNYMSSYGLSTDTYARRHYICAGGFKVSYPNSNEPDESDYEGTVFPYRDHGNVNNFDITALKDNSSYICFIPYGSSIVKHEFIETQDYIAEVGRAYVPSVDFTFNGQPQKAHTVVTCSRASAHLVLSQKAKLTIFYAQRL